MESGINYLIGFPWDGRQAGVCLKMEVNLIWEVGQED